MSKDITIKFDSEAAAMHFAHWLCGSGEQQYWDWMRYREQEEEGNITVVKFRYFPEEPCSDDSFMADGVVRTTTGRLNDAG